MKKISSDQKKINETIEKYERLTIAISLLWKEAKKVYPEFTLEDLFKVARLPLGTKLENWLQRHYILSFPNKFGSFDPDAAIRTGLVKLPDFERLIQSHALVHESLRHDFDVGYYSGIRYPLIRLYDADNDSFLLNKELRNEIEEAYSCFISTQTEARIHETIQDLCKALNRLDGYAQLQGKSSKEKIDFLDRLIIHREGKWHVKHRCLNALGFGNEKPKRDNIERMFEI